MKKILDIKSFIIGILVSIIFVLTLGAVGKKESYFDQITTKKLVITNDNRDLVAYFASEPGGGLLKLFNNKMEERISLRVIDDGSEIKMYSKKGKADISLFRTLAENQAKVELRCTQPIMWALYSCIIKKTS